MPNKVICHYGIKGMKWRKLKKVEPDDKRGMDSPTEGMTKSEKWVYEYKQSPFHDPASYPDYVDREFDEKQLPKSEYDPIKRKKSHVPRAFHPPMTPMKPPKKESGVNIPIKNRMTEATKKKIDEFINSFLKKKVK